MQNLSKQIDFNNLVYYFKGGSGPKIFIDFKGLPGLHRNIKDGYTILEKEEDNQKKFQSDLKEIIKEQ